MGCFEVDFSYSIKEFGSVTLDADDEQEAEMKALQHVKEIYEDVFDIEIEDVREVVEL